MTLERFQLLRNVGQFDSVSSGPELSLKKLALIYAENGRGKTTLAAILRSLSTREGSPILERQRLGATHPPHLVINGTGAPHIFQNGSWGGPLAEIAIFDDLFVAENVCSGIAIDTTHRQNLHELILGVQGLALSQALQNHVSQIEEHNRNLRAHSDAIPAGIRGPFTVEAFCALPPAEGVDLALGQAERDLAAARATDKIRQADAFRALSLPSFETTTIEAVLAKTISELAAETVAQLEAHFARLGNDAEGWVSDGMKRIVPMDSGHDHTACPFCAQDLAQSPIVASYQAYFSEAYHQLRREIDAIIRSLAVSHSGEVFAAFERSIRVGVQTRQFWSEFAEIPELKVDTAAIVRAWTAARDGIQTALRAKQAAPLEKLALPPQVTDSIALFETMRADLAKLSTILLAANGQIALVKERAGSANIAALTSDLQKLTARMARHTEPTTSQCQNYLAEKAAKSATESLRDQARAALDQYRQNIFGTYESSINTYLARFNAGFRLSSFNSVNNRGGSSCTYNVLINNLPVAVTADVGPSFRNTLSAGDRNALALAFFFASLDQDPSLAQKIIVIDDPMTSLDEHRSLTTIQEMRRLLGRVGQVLVLSHSKPFLCALWEGTDQANCSPIRISRDGNGSSLAVWDVRRDSITEHDRRHELVSAYLQSSDPSKERAVAQALRPILEAFIRVAYPAVFPPGSMLGTFIEMCRRRIGVATATEILSVADIAELDALRDYGNRFHHDSNPAWETETINDQELVDFCRRTLAFAHR